MLSAIGRRGRFSPVHRHIFKPRAFGFHAPRLNAAPVHVPPVMPGRFRRPPSTIAPWSSAALWPARSRVPVVGLENKPASQRVTHKLFLLDHRGRRVRFYAVVAFEPRPAVRCGFHRWRGAVEPRPPVWPAPVLRCVGIWGAGLWDRFAFARSVSERRQRFAFWVRGVVFAPSRPPAGPLTPKR